MKKWILIGIALFSALPVQASPAAGKSNRIGYLSLWSLKGGFTVDQVPGDLLTHLVFSFLDISTSGECKILTEAPDDEALTRKTFTSFVQLKTKYPHLKTILSIGGYGSSALFSDVALTEASRKKFVHSCVKLMKQYSFDGIDVDWEYPVHGGMPKNHRRPKDRENYTALISEFRKEMPHPLSLSIAISASVSNLKDLEAKKLAKNLDWFGVMAYDFCQAGSATTCHHSALNPLGRKAVQWLLKNKVKPKQVVLGVPFYGYRWKVRSAKKNGLGQLVSRSDVQDPENVNISYAELMEKYFKKGHPYWDSYVNEPWLFNADDSTMISYDNEKSLALKASYVKKNKLGGVMIWEISGDTPGHELLKALGSR